MASLFNNPGRWLSDTLGIGSGMGEPSDQLKENVLIQERRSKKRSLLSDISENDTISSRTRSDLRSILNPNAEDLTMDEINEAESMFEQATGGKRSERPDKFRSRQATEELFKSLSDKPGRDQFNLASRSNKNSVLGA